MFFERIKIIYAEIDSNIAQLNHLSHQREELLPLLMNGQVSVMPTEVNCDLFFQDHLRPYPPSTANLKSAIYSLNRPFNSSA